MAQSSACRLLVFVFIALSAVSCVVTARRIDCTRFVFAPKCRGVAAKRGIMPVGDDMTSQEDTYTDPLMQPEVARDDDADKLLRLLLDLSHTVSDQSPATQKRREILDRVMRAYNFPEHPEASFRQE